MRKPLVITAIVSLAATVGLVVWWVVTPSYDEHVKSCEKALSSSATKTDRPDACEPLSQDDYDTLLMGWSLQNALDGMSKKDRDMLDYYDNGTIDGSIG